MTAPKILLLGGGHSHAIALRYFAHHPIPEAQIQMIHPGCHALYSGMIPGYLSGQYSREACQIKLQALTQWAGAELIQDEAIALDLDQNHVMCKSGNQISFDLLSINTGSQPTVPGPIRLDDRILAIKPLAQFLDQWARIEATCHSIAIVGAGFGGVEVALNLRARWRHLEIHLFCQGKTVATHAPRSLQQFLMETLESRQIQVHLKAEVMDATRQDEAVILTDRNPNLSGTLDAIKTHRVDAVIFVTQATAPRWLESSGLATDDRGFVAVDRTLRSISHSQVFATGDIATIQDYPLPKSGVFAVRQGKPLAKNLDRALRHQPLRPMRLNGFDRDQPEFFPASPPVLSLLNLGEGAAIACYGEISITSPRMQSLLWRLKDQIDRGFMHKLSPS